MLGLGSNMMKHPVTGKSIVRDGLVLQHNYNLSSVEPLSSGAAYFDGTDEYVNIGALCPTGNFTITSWVKKTGTGGWYAIFSAGTQIWFGLNANGYILAHVGGPSFSAAGVVDTNKWHNCTLTWDGTSAYIYVDGVQVATSTSVDNPTALAYHIGKLSNSAQNFFSGYMCNIGLWSEALSQAQVKSIMNKNYDSLSASEKTDLVSWWNLDSVIPDTTTLVYDNHHGGGEVLGSELVTDNFVGWSTTGDVAITDGKAVFTDANEYTETRNTSGDYLVSGNTYKLVIDIESQSGTGNLAYRYDGGGVITITGGAGVKTVYFTAPSNGEVWIQTNGTPTNLSAVINSVSVKLVNGNTGTLS